MSLGVERKDKGVEGDSPGKDIGSVGVMPVFQVGDRLEQRSREGESSFVDDG